MKTKKMAIVVAALVTTCLIGGAAFADGPLIFGGESPGYSPASPSLSVETYQSTVLLGWTSVGGATGYTLFYAPYPYTGPDSIKSIDVGTKKSIGVDLPVGAAYYVGVKAYNSSGSSGYSNIELFTIPGVACVVSTDDDGTVAMASVTEGDSDIDNAMVTVNDVVLNYGPSLEFQTAEGFDVNVILPIYYADLSHLTYGDKLHLTARMIDDGTMIFDRRNVTIPVKPTLVQPTKCQIIGANEDVPMQWDRAADAEGYVVGYVEGDAFDQDSTDDDVGIYAEYVDASITEATVPSAYTVVGDATFSVSAVTGDTDIFTSEEDPTESFFIVETSDWVDAKIVASDYSSAENRGSQGLICKEYTKKIEGYRFKIRECDPNQISAPGTVQIGFKMRRYKASIAFIQAFDMKGNKYYSWEKKRIYKSKNKKYYPSLSVSVGTTIVFGTHDASYRGGTYSY